MAGSSSAKKASPKTKTAEAGFTAEEREAMKERSRELKSEKRGGGRGSKVDGEQELVAKLAEMPDADRAIGERLHAIITATAPELTPKTWYGMPAYAKDGKVVCFFQNASKFKARYSTLGFNDAARLDDGPMWPTTFALTELTPAVEERIAGLVKQALS